MPASIQLLDPTDNAVVALRAVAAGETVEAWTLLTAVPAKHKFAAEPLPAGSDVRMYGTIAGRTTRDVQRGELLTRENTTHAVAAPEIRGQRSRWKMPDVSRWKGRTFDGYRRADGRCGTANYWVVLPMVFCENRNVDVMREALTKGLGYAITTPYTEFVAQLASAHRSGSALDSVQLAASGETQRVFPGVDGVKFLTHAMGCGGTRQDARALCGLLAGYIAHPNVAGATVLSLGCENAQSSILREELARRQPSGTKPVLFFEQQRAASEQSLIATALRETIRGIAAANDLRREPCPLSELVLGLKCGGSDGFSGISANPALGHCSDLLCALGGSGVLCEFPELCGAEQWLCDRCEDPALAEKFLDLMTRYDARAREVGSGFEMNPSPGNIRDGLITDAMKSLGAARKSGTAPIADVLDYPELVARRGGVTLLCTPGNDVEATTALTGSGCNLIVFTTGLGTPTGNPICPVVKMSTNTDLTTRMPDLIDFDAGPIIHGKETIATAGERLLDTLIEVASGRITTASTRLAQDDFLPWKRGVSL